MQVDEHRPFVRSARTLALVRLRALVLVGRFLARTFVLLRTLGGVAGAFLNLVGVRSALGFVVVGGLGVVFRTRRGGGVRSRDGIGGGDGVGRRSRVYGKACASRRWSSALCAERSTNVAANAANSASVTRKSTLHSSVRRCVMSNFTRMLIDQLATRVVAG